ncbi:RluA family pseudouridine synthase [Parvibium lacunae]|uniref:Pseudouridine synthase n=1 Tax=Parvibium lacunae TaxID=1888893 RepID=A0A368L3S1_9BURK|nr:RluA family pseudouridine synthase [Parvibium lacunae]RCS58246.1 RluA family pseudouridine synthase [Parvibium lacunae]
MATPEGKTQRELITNSALLRADQVNFVLVDDSIAGQRIDNFLCKICKGVPKSHLYRIVRNGEVRVNKGRISVDYKLAHGDLLRIPPMRVAQVNQGGKESAPAADFPVLYEDEALLVINKPAGVAVHGGSGVSFGVIEQLRAARPEAKFLELVHRLDRETSGVLLVAKKRAALVALHRQIREGQMDKRYIALVKGRWTNPRQAVKQPLHKYTLPDGERRVRVQADGLPSHTIFTLQARYQHSQVGPCSLLEAQLLTGRTHQIRVHLQHLGFPIVGDDKYGDYSLNKVLQRADAMPSLKRMFLHAVQLSLPHPISGEPLILQAPLAPTCDTFLQHLTKESA